MKVMNVHSLRTASYYLSIGILAASTLAFGQDTGMPSAPADQQSASASGGWKRVGNAPAPEDQSTVSSNSDPNQGAAYPAMQQPADANQQAPADQPQAPAEQGPQQQPMTQPPPPGYAPRSEPNGPGGYGPAGNGQGGYGQGGYGGYQQPGYQQAPYQQPMAPQPVPSQLTIPAGTYITVRVNQLLSSDRNQDGDAFSASLVQPVVVGGVVLAEPGETVGGRVAEAKKAGRIEGVARLGLQLTTLTLVDGQQLPIQCQLISRSGPTSVGQDAGAIVGTTALGAAVGAVAGWGRGAAIGAGAGAAVGIIGVLVTRGHPSIITPEQVLTFKILAPVTVSTTQAPQAFRYVQPYEYDRPNGGGYAGPGYGDPYYASAAPAPYYYGPYSYAYPYYYAGYPYYWGPGLGFYWGGFYGRGWYGGRFYGGRYWGGAYGRVGGAYGRVGGGVAHAGGGAVGHAGGGGGRR
jgi:hypothetical protein